MLSLPPHSRVLIIMCDFVQCVCSFVRSQCIYVFFLLTWCTVRPPCAIPFIVGFMFDLFVYTLEYAYTNTPFGFADELSFFCYLHSFLMILLLTIVAAIHTEWPAYEFAFMPFVMLLFIVATILSVLLLFLVHTCMLVKPKAIDIGGGVGGGRVVFSHVMLCKLIGCALSDRDIDHNSKVLNAFYLFIEYIHFVCLKHTTGRDIFVYMCVCIRFSVVSPPNWW